MSAILASGIRALECGSRCRRALELVGGACLTLGLLALVALAGAGSTYVW
jgi:hypothetical protein